MLNTQTNNFLAVLTKLVNECGLPVVNARLCLDLVRMQLAEAERAAMEQEKQAEKAKEAKKNG
ncbi:MAG: hypothetical protein LUD78_02410 [Clostridiales bacterium]|nr:hypothetical protein [Clostridiales bacterium]